MKSLRILRREATESCKYRGHTMRWSSPSHSKSKSVQHASCKDCGAWVQVETKPALNGIDIGGPAVALGCHT